MSVEMWEDASFLGALSLSLDLGLGVTSGKPSLIPGLG